MKGVVIKGIAVALLGFGLGVASCGSSDGGNTAALCKEGAQASCDKMWDCAEGEPYRADDTKAACVSAGNADCAGTPCPSGTTYHADKAQQCVDAIKAATCAQVGSSNGDALFPAVCFESCS